MQTLPATYRKLVATRHGKDYHSITEVVEVPLEQPGPGKVLIKNAYAGVNASDINITSGAYGGLPPLPMDLGVEAVGTVVAIGDGVNGVSVGDAVMYLHRGAYGEYNTLGEKHLYRLPAVSPEALPLIASGVTAAVGLNKFGEMKSGDVVLVTGAAGGTGQFAVQLAKLAGNHVIAVVGSDDKEGVVRALGADRVINYRKEDLNTVLRAEYPKGIDLIYECIGGKTFDACVDNLAVLGRLLVVGYISEYQGQPEPVLQPRIYTKLLWKSASIRGFISSAYPDVQRAETLRLIELWHQGKLKSLVEDAEFRGPEGVGAALDHLYSGTSIGKVIVKMGDAK